MTMFLNRAVGDDPGRCVRASLRLLLTTIGCLLAVQALAMELYTVSVPMDPRDPNARETAYRDALELVLVRVTGSDDEAEREALTEVFPNAGRYVLRFRPDGDDTLEVTFDGEAIERMLRQTRYAIWDADRPLTLVWLAVDWGEGEREIVGANDEMLSIDATRSIDRNRLLRERVEAVAERRGIPVAFPLLDAVDLEAVSFSEIWGGFDGPLLEASRRYGASSILVGRVRPDSAFDNRWTYFFGDEQLAWGGEPEEVVNLLADQLAAQFAISGDAELESYTVLIDGIDNVVAYGRVDQMMSNLGVLEEFALRKVAGRQIEYRVSVYGGVDRLSKALELSGIIQPQLVVDADAMSPIPNPYLLTFEYRP